MQSPRFYSILTYVTTVMLSGALLMSCCSTTHVPTDEPVIVSVPARTWDAERFALAVETLKAECPLNADAAVVVHLTPGYWGYCFWNEAAGVYEIHINSRQAMHSIIDTLIHEWAHAMVWDSSRDEVYGDHGPIWGVAQARCYRAVLIALQAYGADQDLQTLPEAGDPCFGAGVGVGVKFTQEFTLEHPPHNCICAHSRALF